jgi:hypothetical protein
MISTPRTEPVFVNLSRRPGIDSQPVGPVRQPYLSYRPSRLHRLAESIPWHRFLGSINVYKYGLRLHYGSETVAKRFHAESSRDTDDLLDLLEGIDLRNGQKGGGVALEKIKQVFAQVCLHTPL